MASSSSSSSSCSYSYSSSTALQRAALRAAAADRRSAADAAERAYSASPRAGGHSVAAGASQQRAVGHSVAGAPAPPHAGSELVDLTSDTDEAPPPSAPAAAPSAALIDREGHLHSPGCASQPSTCACAGVAWLWASLPHARPGRHTGKWLLFPPAMAVDATWAHVRALLAAGHLGVLAKASRAEPGGSRHVICIYTQDHTDVADVARVLLALRTRPPPGHDGRGLLSYKTDDDTRAGVYSAASAQRGGAAAGPSATPASLYTSPKVEDDVVRLVRRADPASGQPRIIMAEWHWAAEHALGDEPRMRLLVPPVAYLTPGEQRKAGVQASRKRASSEVVVGPVRGEKGGGGRGKALR